MDKDQEEDFWCLLESFLINMILKPNNKIKVNRSSKDIVAEVNRSKRAKRKLNQVIADYFDRPKGRAYIKYREVWIALIDHLGDNIPLSREVERRLKLSLDYTKLSKRKRQWIRWHAVAQIIALEDPRKKVSAIKSEILGDHRLDRLLEFGTLPSLGNPEKKREDRFREIENAIGEVVKWGVGRPAKDSQSTVVISPLVYSDGKVNFQALLAAMSAVGSVLKIWDRSLPENYALSVIDLYKKALPISPIINDFIHIGIWTYYNGRGEDEYYD